MINAKYILFVVLIAIWHDDVAWILDNKGCLASLQQSEVFK